LTTFERLLSSTAVFNIEGVAAGAGDVPAGSPPVADVEPPAPAVAQDHDPVEPVADPAPVEPAKSPWFMKRISEEAEAKREAIKRAEAAERRANEAVALAERLQRDPKPDGTYTRSGPTPVPQPSQFSQADVQREASRMKLHEDSTEVLNRGMTTFGASFQGSLAVLNAANVVNNDEFVADLIAVDRANAHILLDRLAKEPERAATLAAMNSRQRIAELTRMSMQPAGKDTKPAAPGVSRAPAPAPHVAASSSNVKDWRVDDASDEEFDRGFSETMKKRSRRR
jgi:hypothetical protein